MLLFLRVNWLLSDWLDVLLQHFWIEYIIDIEHGAEIVDKHFRFRDSCSIYRHMSGRVSRDSQWLSTDCLIHFIILQVSIVETAFNKMIENQLGTTFRTEHFVGQFIKAIFLECIVKWNEKCVV